MTERDAGTLPEARCTGAAEAAADPIPPDQRDRAPESASWLKNLRVLERSVVFKLAAAAAASVGVVLGIAIWFAEPALITIEAETETVAYRVARTGFAAIVSYQPIEMDAGSPCAEALDGTVPVRIEPAEGTTVRYTQFRRLVSIQLLAPEGEVAAGTLTTTAECALPRMARFVVQLGAEKGGTNVALPIAGPIEIGLEQIRQKPTGSEAANAGLLLRATLRVYGRTSWPGSGGNIYPAEGGTFEVPAGGRLTTKAEGMQDPAYGYALAGENALRVSISTES
ncbi:MAG: hypothetical protein AAFQ11_07325, partial [Pseudomonadota bacterium]